MAFAKVQSANGSGSSIALTGVGAGHLIVMLASWSGGSGSITISDGTSSLTMGSVYRTASGGQFSGQVGWLLSANSGNKTYTITGESATDIIIWEFSYSNSCFHDFETGTNGHSTSVSSGTQSSSGLDELYVACAGTYNTETWSSLQIGGNAATGSQAGKTYDESWYYAYSGAFSGAATATIGSDYWLCVLESFIEEVPWNPGTSGFPYIQNKDPIFPVSEIIPY